MANFTHIARPYAQAAFEYAREHQVLSDWTLFLNSAATAIKYPDIQSWLANPELSTSTVLALFRELLAPYLDAHRDHFLQLLIEHKRLIILPAIADLFNAHCAQLEKMSNVRVVTAVASDEAFQHQLALALKNRMQFEVNLTCQVDPAIIGGAIIHIGDKVIDGSIRGKLSRLLQSLAG